MTRKEIIDCLQELKIGMPERIHDIADYIERDSIGLGLRIRNCGFSVEDFLITIGIPLHCIPDVLLLLTEHQYNTPESIASLDREKITLLHKELKIGIRVKLLLGVVLLRYLGYSNYSG